MRVTVRIAPEVQNIGNRQKQKRVFIKLCQLKNN
jgi:hypothetical protein